MPIALPIAALKPLLDRIGNAPLDSSTLDSAPLTADFSTNAPFGSDVLTLNLRGGVQLSLFNSLDDKDADGLLVAKGSNADVFGGGTPTLELTNDAAWLKYRYEAGLKASVGTSLATLGFTLAAEANASAILTDYRRHDHAQLAQEAVLADLESGPRLAALLAHVEKLDIRDAVAIQLAAALKLAVTVSWADVFTSHLGTLTALLKSDAPIGIKVKTGASVTVTVAVTDDFIVAFARNGADEWQIGVKKAAVRSIGAALHAGLDVQIANAADVDAVVQPVLDALFAATTDKIVPLLNKATLADLNEIERRLALLLMRRLGLDPLFAKLEDLKARIEDVKENVKARVEEALKTKVALSFAYEYQRTSTATELLQATVSRQRLQALHADCIHGNFGPALNAIRAKTPGIGLVQYLNEKEIERKASWGFTLGVGKWLKIGGTDTRDIKSVTRGNIDPKQRQESYLGFRGYKGSWVGETFEWGGDLKADMPGFSDDPRASDFTYGIHLLWKQTHDRLSDDDVDIFLDAAVLWGVISQVEAAQRRPELIAAKDKACTATVQLTVADKETKRTFRALLSALGSAPAISSALAAAMPWRAGSVGRTQVAIRRSAYAPLFQKYLDQPDLQPSELASAANRFFAHGDFSDLGVLELHFKAVRPFTFAGLAELNSDTPARAVGFRRALDTLRAGIESRAGSQATLKPVFHDLSAFWEQSHHVRAAGAYLVEVARSAAVLDDVERTATFTVDGETLVVG
jgi:hypothetical protein